MGMVVEAAVPGEQVGGVGEGYRWGAEQGAQVTRRLLRGYRRQPRAESRGGQRGGVQGAEGGTVGLGAEVARAKPADETESGSHARHCRRHRMSRRGSAGQRGGARWKG